MDVTRRNLRLGIGLVGALCALGGGRAFASLPAADSLAAAGAGQAPLHALSATGEPAVRRVAPPPRPPSAQSDAGEEELRRAIEARLDEAGADGPELAGRGPRWHHSPLFDEAQRAELIAAQRPAAPRQISGLWQRAVPAPLRARLWSHAGAALEAVSAYEEARLAYARAIGLGHEESATWRGLAHARVRAGDLDGAEGALLAALEGARRDPDLLRELGELHLLRHEARAAVEVLEEAERLAPGDPRPTGLLLRARHHLDPQAHPAPARSWPVWTRPEESDWRGRAEHRLSAWANALPPALARPLDRLAARLVERRGVTAAGAILIFLCALLIVVRARRGRGDLVVCIDYPSELRGTFSVRLSTQRGRHRRGRGERADVLQGGTSTRTEHHLVGRETHFRKLRARSYWVSVEGILQDSDCQEVLGDPFDERPVQVVAGGTARLEIDFQPRECPVDVRVLWDKKPVKEAGVSARGAPQSLRYARGGSMRIALPKGRHTLVIGSGDRVAEQEVEVSSHQPTAVEVDLAGAAHIIFKGCPPAVEAYLQGDLGAAARALEREGQAREAHLLRARRHREEGAFERAAEHFEQAERWLEAAQLRAELGHWSAAAPLYLRSGDALRAAEMFREAGELASAGQAYEQARDLDRALECFRTAGETSKWLELLERRGEAFEAAQVALESGDRSRAIRLLQVISPDDSHFEQACEQLAQVFEEEGHVDLAAQRLQDYLEASKEAPGRFCNLELVSRLAELHERGGHFERALAALEALKQRDPTFPQIATRIEELRKRQSEAAREASSAQRTTARRLSGSDLATTGFLADQRYELLEEIGRGGMGIVFKARDRRLDRIVALKRLPENLRDHPKAIQLFLREAQASARLTHRNITTVYDADQEAGVFFITMELLQGSPLNRILTRHKQLSARDTARIGLQIADGLHYAHEQRVVHRDIKTANLFFTQDRTVKIMDFGLAKMMEEVRRAATVIGGTPYYMAPEQAAGDNVDHRADVYAFGATLFELATGRVPFTEGDVTYHHRHTPPPDPKTLVPELPDELARLILHMLAKRVEDRCPSAADVRRRLEPLAR